MVTEIDKINALGVAERVDERATIPSGKRPLDLRWVYAWKFDLKGYLE